MSGSIDGQKFFTPTSRWVANPYSGQQKINYQQTGKSACMDQGVGKADFVKMKRAALISFFLNKKHIPLFAQHK
jgi:hypothetical protein